MAPRASALLRIVIRVAMALLAGAAGYIEAGVTAMRQANDRLESEPDRRNGFRTLSLRLTKEQYRRLRRFIIKHEIETGELVSQQDLISAALTAYLDQKSS